MSVSVPLSGLASVNVCVCVCGFRPLIGVSFCKRKIDMVGGDSDHVSVPLSGLASVNTHGGITFHADDVLFPSPYRG